MLELSRSTVNRLQQLDVQLDVPDRNTVVLRHVPVNRDYFDNPQTNLLVKRPRSGMPFVVGVNADLCYIGADPKLAHAFAAATVQQGWKMLNLTLAAHHQLQAAVDFALAIVGLDGEVPQMPGAGERSSAGGPPRYLGKYGVDLSDLARQDRLEPTVGREDAVVDVIATLLRNGQTATPILTGPSGVGKTNLVQAVARKLLQVRPDLRLITLDLNPLLVGTLFEGEFENICTSLLEELRGNPQTVLALEHFELAFVGRVPRLLIESLDRGGISLLGTLLPEFLEALQPPLLRRLELVPVRKPTSHEAVAICTAHCQALIDHHRVAIDEQLVRASVRAVRDVPGVLPAKALAVLDGAASRAAVLGAPAVTLDDIYYVASRLTQRRRSVDLDEE